MHQTSPVWCMLHANCLAPAVQVSQIKGTNKMSSQHMTYTSCPHMLGHAAQYDHLLPNCLGTEGSGKHKVSCALETIHTWTCETNIA